MSNTPPISTIPAYKDPNELTWEEVRSSGLDPADADDVPEFEHGGTATILPFPQKTARTL